MNENKEWSELMGKANVGDVPAMVKVGNALRNGNKRLMVRKDVYSGIEWLEKAANLGSAEAMRILVRAYERLADAGTYFDFGAIKQSEYWKSQLAKLQPTESGSASSSRILLGKGKKRLGRLSFQNRMDLIHVEIAPSVEEIGYSAFEGCTNLESITFPASLKRSKATHCLGASSFRVWNSPRLFR